MNDLSPLATLILEYGDSLTRMDGERDLQKQIVTRAEAECHVQPYVKFAGDSEYGHEWIEDWKEWASQQKELSPEFVKIVEENFWELLA